MIINQKFVHANMEGTDKKDRLWAAIATIVFHALLLTALMFMALRTPLPLPAEEGIEVNLGYTDEGSGNIQAEQTAQVVSRVPPSVAPAQSVDEEFATQISDDAPSMPERRNLRSENDLRPVRTEPAPRPSRETPEATRPATDPQPTINERALFRSSGQSNTSGSDGTGSQQGDQGRQDGLREVNRYDGQGGQGGGPSFSLEGRGALFIDKPGNNFRERGVVVVDIWVDQSGKVVRAEINLRRTNIVDVNLRNQALMAALNSKFTANATAPNEQRGTITYTFTLSY